MLLSILFSTWHSVFRNILRDLLSERYIRDNISVPSNISKRTGIGNLHEWDFDSLSLSTMSTLNTARTASGDRLKEICDELGAPVGFMEIVGYHLLGYNSTTLNFASKQKAPIINEIIGFMAKLFLHCTSHADLTIVALDDVQHMDHFSWKVIQNLYETGANILFVCGSRPSGLRSMVDDEFWINLSGKQKECGRFQELYMKPLSHLEISIMMSMLLSCKVEELDNEFVKEIFDNTRGMPHFAFQALESCKRKGLFEKMRNNKIGWRKLKSEVCGISFIIFFSMSVSVQNISLLCTFMCNPGKIAIL